MAGGEMTPVAPNADVVYSLSEQETLDLGRRMAQNLKGGELIVLEGDLGMGKTVFARGIAAGLGIDEDEVRSPSFAMVSTPSDRFAGGRSDARAPAPRAGPDRRCEIIARSAALRGERALW